MGFMSDYQTALKKLKKEEEATDKTISKSGSSGFMDTYKAELGRLQAERKAKQPQMLSPTIAPTKEDDTKDLFGMDFFQKGSFEDGYQFGDVTKAILGTAGDVGTNIIKGVAGVGEGIGDFIGYGAAGLLDAVGAAGAADVIRKGANKNQTEEKFKAVEEFFDKGSLLGETSDSISEAIGQVGATVAVGALGGGAGLGTLGSTLLTSGTMFASGTGSGISEAYRGGATDKEAYQYGLASGTADAVSELLFGGLGKAANAVGFGKGLTSFDDMAAKAVSKFIKSPTGKNVAEWLVKSGFEGLEEVGAGLAQAAAKKMTYMSEKDFADILEDENLFEQFVVGSFASGMMQSGVVPGTVGGSLKEANQTGKDFITGMTQNEQKVVDKIYGERLAELEKKGKVSAKEKRELYEAVESDLDKGYLSTNTIEEMFGGESYTKYKESAEQEKSLQDEYDTLSKEYDDLYNRKLGDKSSKDTDREAELKDMLPKLKQKLDGMQSTVNLKELRDQMESDIFDQVKGDRLENSYAEKFRARQKFEADVSQYDEKYRKTYERAMESGVLNNTNRSHELVDFIAKIEADKGVPFDFTNDEKIKETQFAVEGKRVNGYKTDSGIVINVQSPKYLQSTVGHEITHVLEGTEFYKTLSEAVKNYAIAKEGLDAFNARLKATEERYKGMKNTTAEQELVADLVGDYLFQDGDFVKKLSTENRNVFQKIYDEIKYLCKIVTAGSKEARELERVKKAFEDAYRADVKKQDKTQHSLSETTDGRFVAVVDNDILSKIDTSTWDKKTKKKAKSAANTELKKFSDGFTINGIEFIGNKSTRDEYTRSDYTDALARKNHTAFFDKMRASTVLDDVIRVATDWKNDNELKYEREDYVDFVRGKTLIMSGDRTYSAVVLAGITSDGKAIFHDVVDITPDSFEIKKEESSTAVSENESPNAILEDSSGKTVAQENGKVKTQFSISDSDGKQLSKGQQEYFKDSKVRDENGNLKVMYHGTPNGDFTIFKDGTYFTDSKEYADRYQNPGASSISSGKTASAPKTFEVYLNIKKPFDINDAEARRIYIEEYIKGGNAMGINPYLSDAEYAKIQTIDWTEGEDLRDFLIDNGYDYDGLVLDEGADGGYGDEVKSRGTSYVIFNAEQAKNIDNVKPTSDPDIRFSLSDAVEETKDLMAIHNLHSSELLKQLQMGGMAYPSIAITKPGMISHEDFGEISVVLNKDAIDPKNSKYNKVYSADAYTPTFPNVDYEASEEVAARIADKVNSLYSNLPDYYQRSVRSLRDFSNIDDELNRWGGEQRYIEKYAEDYGLKQIYLAEKGETVPVEMKTTEKRMTDYQLNLYKTVVDSLGEDVLKSFNEKGDYEKLGFARIAWLEKHGGKLKDIYAEDWSKDGTMTKEEAMEIADEQTKLYWRDEIRRALEYLENGGVTVTESEDISSTNAKIDEKIANSDYKQWFENLFVGIEGKSGIRNNKDIFTPSGNRRSFSQTHDPLTVDNIVKVMRKENQKGQGAFGGGSILGAATQEYGSIAEIKRNSGKLGTMDKAEHDAIKDRINDTFWDIAKRYANGKDIIDAQEAIAEAVSKNESKAGIARYLKQYDYVYNYTDSIGDEIIALRDYIRSLPTTYFESKPQRGVGFDEVAVFVIPYDADVKLKQELLNRGYAIAEYDPNVEGDRSRVLNQFEEYKFSLSNIGEQPKKYGDFATLGKDVAYTPETAPVTEVTEVTEATDMFPDNLAPVQADIEKLEAQREQVRSGLETALEHGTANEVSQLAEEYDSLTARIRELEAEDNQRADSLTDADAPPEMDAPYYGDNNSAPVENPFENREWDEVTGTKGRKAKAYMYEHPEVKPFFQAEAQNLLGELNDTQRGERWYNDELHYESGGEKGFMGVKRLTSESMKTMLDEWGMSYDDIEKGLKAIIEDNGAENISAAKKIEFMLNDRLLNGYKNFYDRGYIEPNQEYINLVEEMQIDSYRQDTFDAFMATADQYAPVEPMKPTETVNTNSQKGVIKGQQTYITTEDKLNRPQSDRIADAPIFDSKDKTAVRGQQTMFEPPKPNPKVANVLTEESAIAKKKSGIGLKLATALVDKGQVFENLSLKTKNREIQAKWNYALPSNTEARAQYFMEHGAEGVKSLKSIMDEVDKTGKTDDFYNYLYHVHNIDRMTLDERFGVENKTVFGETITADVSRRKAARYLNKNPEFQKWANDIYAFNKHLRKMLVDGDVISQKTADLWEKRYPHYVPIRRVDTEGLNINVPLDTKKTGVNAPIKKATGGNSNIEPLFQTMAMRTEQIFRAVARNSFGIELKNTLGTTINQQMNNMGVDEAIDTIDAQEDHLLKAGTKNSNPTFTVFENGERVEFEITEDMFDALRPAGKLLGHRFENSKKKAVRAVGKALDARRNLLTVWNPVFALYRNPIKDLQDVAVNSQHAAKTYKNIPTAIYHMATGGQYATEYHQNGGKSNTYFDSRTNKFKKEDNAFKKIFGMPFRAIETAGEFIEEIPRLAEYIASRQEGRSVEQSMLDAARVTTNFAAGGDFTKFLNSHGFTFLNASVQGASQHVRNFREAKQQGLKGYAKVLSKYVIAGLPTILLNSLLWDDDEEYEELSDYVKQNYYVVAKTQDGKFVRIPKGRTAAVMGELMNQMEHLVTGNDEVDFSTFYELFMNNIAPSNPLENNVIAPVLQVASNTAWYGGDLVPSRLQKLPDEEQFDESTDYISKWLGEKTGFSPYKINYLLDQYSGGLGDVFLPMLTPEAESGDNSFMGNMLAPWKKEITTDKVLNNKNPGDFYDLRDELEIKSNSRNATEEDAMRSMYMDSVSWEMSDLYAQKREVQNSDLPDDEKYETVRQLQEQINELAKNAMNVYNRVEISGLYSEVGDKRYNKDAESGKWYEIRKTNSDGSANSYYQKEQEVTKTLGITSAEYWNNREEYNYAYDKPEQYALAQSVGGYQSYRSYTSQLWDIKADKDENGKSISGSRKEKVIDYLNNLDADYYTKIILFKNEYNADDTYNMEIIEYLNSRADISYQQMETILKYLGFEVDEEGNISW